MIVIIIFVMKWTMTLKICRVDGQTYKNLKFPVAYENKAGVINKSFIFK